ncbi:MULTISPECIES: hypothetical protein [Trichocoleus]|uniref:Tetratricopeptide repeat protein n=1 Tax=Trichocoleus desertorum GB2-A4 TaxID=2933944 RepID=A0ABV0JA41_9CYAN|nr:hypothetical protein [Trichocoleus sp. FACHB-46]
MRLRLILSSLVLAPLLNLIHPISGALAQEEVGPALTEAELLTSLAGDYANIGQKDQAIQLLKEPLSLNQSLVEPCHKLSLLASVAGQYAFVGQKVKSSEVFSQARNILEATEYCGPEPSSSAWSDPTTWISLAFLNHVRASQYDTAFQIATGFGEQYIEPIQNGLEYRNAVKDPEWIKLNVAIQRKLANFYFRTKEFNKARTIWLALADYYKEQGKLEQVTQFQNLASKIEPTKADDPVGSQSPKEIARRSLFECFQKLRLLYPDVTWTLTRTLDTENPIGPEELKPILDLCKEEKFTAKNTVSTQQIVQALEQIAVTSHQISAPIKRADLLAAIANIYGQLKKDTEATKLLDQSLSSLKAGLESKLDDRYEASAVLVSIISGYLDIQRVDQALEVAQMVRAGEIKLAAPDFANIVVGPKFAYDSLMPPVVGFYAEIGNFESALQLANSLGRGHQDDALFRITEQYVLIEQYSKALQTAQMINPFDADLIYNILAVAVKSGQIEWAKQATLTLDWAVQTAEAMEEEADYTNVETVSSLTYRNRLLLMIAREYAQSKKLTQALNVTAQIGVNEFGKVPKSEALRAIARQYAKAGQTKEAVKLLNQAVEIARSISPN